MTAVATLTTSQDHNPKVDEVTENADKVYHLICEYCNGVRNWGTVKVGDRMVGMCGAEQYILPGNPGNDWNECPMCADILDTGTCVNGHGASMFGWF